MSDFLWPYGLQPTRLLCLWNFPGKNTGVGCHFLLQGIFPTKGSNPCLLSLLHCRQIHYCWASGEAQIVLYVYPNELSLKRSHRHFSKMLSFGTNPRLLLEGYFIFEWLEHILPFKTIINDCFLKHQSLNLDICHLWICLYKFVFENINSRI